MNRQLRFLATLLALVAIVALLGAGMQVHADGADHPNCWLCLSSIGSVAIQALAISIFISWTCLGLSRVFVASTHTQAALPAPSSRAPPYAPSI